MLVNVFNIQHHSGFYIFDLNNASVGDEALNKDTFLNFSILKRPNAKTNYEFLCKQRFGVLMSYQQRSAITATGVYVQPSEKPRPLTSGRRKKKVMVKIKYTRVKITKT